jgi:hypothetical protein
MLRLLSAGFTALAFCALQSGCCCRCGLPFFAPAPPQIVVNVPNDPPVFNPPRDNAPVFKPPEFKGPKEYVYKQTTGQLMLDNQVIGTGYSGKGVGKNNPAMQNQKNIGPIPAGDYIIHIRQTDQKTGEPVIILHPATETFGRWPGETFCIQPDSNPPGNAPAAGIVMPRDVREKIDTAPLTKVRVVQ